MIPSQAVGYCRPPVEHQFMKGRTGNPKGRPPKPRTIYDVAAKVLAEPVEAMIDGKVVRLSTLRAMFRQVCHRALRGNVTALKRVFDMIFAIQPPGADPEAVAEAEIWELLETMAKVAKMPVSDFLKPDPILTPEEEAAEKAMRKRVDAKLAAKRRELEAQDRARLEQP